MIRCQQVLGDLVIGDPNLPTRDSNTRQQVNPPPDVHNYQQEQELQA